MVEIQRMKDDEDAVRSALSSLKTATGYEPRHCKTLSLSQALAWAAGC